MKRFDFMSFLIIGYLLVSIPIILYVGNSARKSEVEIAQETVKATETTCETLHQTRNQYVIRCVTREVKELKDGGSNQERESYHYPKDRDF